MAYTMLPDNIFDVGDPTKRDIFYRLQQNQEDFNTRLDSLEGTSSKIIIIDEIIKKSTEHKIGDIKFSFLTESQFQAEFDTTWILADGRSVVGSDYATLSGNTTAPDMRGRYPRMKDHSAGVNPDGELDLGDLQADTYTEHNHTTVNHSHGVTDSGHIHALSNDSHSHVVTDTGHVHSLTSTNHTHNVIVTDPGHAHTDAGHKHPLRQIATGVVTACIATTNTTSNDFQLAETTLIDTGYASINSNTTGITAATQNPAAWTPSAVSNTTGLTVNSAATGGTIDNNTTGISVDNGSVTVNNSGNDETRPKTITVNAFIKINDSSHVMVKLFKSPFAFNLTGAVLNNLVAGSAGTLQIDVLKGSSPDSLSTIFSTNPSINYSAGNYANSSNVVFSTTTISAGDWIALTVESFQTNQNKFHFSLTGEV